MSFGTLYVRRRGLELEIDFDGSESKAILALEKIRFVVYDEFSDTYRALPIAYWDIVEVFSRIGFKIVSELNNDFTLNYNIHLTMTLRSYQKEIIDKLRKRHWRGVVVLPTGAGKTLIAVYSIAEIKQKTLIVVPTIDLMHQWKDKLREFLGLSSDSIGLWGGGSRSVKDITIATYQSASRRDFLELNMDKFNIVIFDEVHHLPAATYIEIAKRLIARYRIGLTATPKRSDSREELLRVFVGDFIFGPSTRTLAEDGYLAKYIYERINIKMSKEEYSQYKQLMRVYREYIEEKFPHLSGRKAFDAVVKNAWKDRLAKEALEARMKAKSIAMAPKAKIEKLNELLKAHRDDKVIIFTRLKRTAYRISALFGIPVITSDTPKSVRQKILKLFEQGKVTKLVSAEALDEGIDVPDASVGIIISGTSSERQYIQRVGRLLRPKEKHAKIYELVTVKSFDEFMAKARKGLVR